MTTNAARVVAREIVSDWYRRWTGHPRIPTPREISQTRQWVEAHGEEMMRRAIPVLVTIMKASWPDAQRWGAVAAYMEDALDELAERDRRAEKERLRRIEQDRTMADRRLADEERRQLIERQEREAAAYLAGLDPEVFRRLVADTKGRIGRGESDPAPSAPLLASIARGVFTPAGRA